MSALLAALRLGLSHWKLALTGLGFLLLGILLAAARADGRHWRKAAERYQGLYQGERSAHAATVESYRRAAALARAQDQANAARAERAQAAISKEVSNDYQARLAALRGRYDALRLRGAGAAPADPGAGRGEDLPGPGQGPAGAAPPAGAEGLSLDDRLLCSAQAEQLDALIDWVERQQAVPAGRDAQPPPQ